MNHDPATPAPPPVGFELLDEPETFIDHVGPLFIRREEKSAQTWLRLEKRHTNPNGTAHGGILMTLMDITLGSTASAYLGHTGGAHPTTIQLSCSLMAAAREGEIVRGEARVDSATRSLAFVSGRLHVAGRTVMSGSAVFRNPPRTEEHAAPAKA